MAVVIVVQRKREIGERYFMRWGRALASGHRVLMTSWGLAGARLFDVHEDPSSSPLSRALERLSRYELSVLRTVDVSIIDDEGPK